MKLTNFIDKHPKILLGLFWLGVLFYVSMNTLHSDAIGQDNTRHLFTGIFFLDLWKSLPVENLHDFAFSYYAKYPSLGLLHWPPFFHITESICFWVFGIHVEVARLLVLAYAFLGSAYIYRTSREMGAGAFGGVIGSMVFLCMPIVFQMSQQIMLELPSVSLAIVAFFYFLIYLRQNNFTALLLSGGFAVASVLTKETGVYLIFLFAAAGFQKKGWKLLEDGKLYVVAILAASIVLAYNYYASQYTGVRTLTLFKDYKPVLFWVNATFLIKNFGWLPCVLLLLVVVQSWRHKKWSWLLFLSVGITTTFLLISFVRFPMQRHLMAPAHIFALAIAFTPSVLPAKWGINRWIPFAALFLQSVLAFMGSYPVVNGYQGISETLLSRPEGASIFIHTLLPGNVSFHTRRLEPANQRFLLSSSKLLSYESNDEEVQESLNSADEILHLLDQYGVKYLLVESRNKSYHKPGIYEVFRELIQRPEHFTHLQKFPIQDTLSGDSTISLYEFNGDGVFKAESIQFKMGRMLNTDISVPIR
jgi:hypothetical protein